MIRPVGMTTVRITDKTQDAVVHGPWILARGPFTRHALRQQAYLAGTFFLAQVQFLWVLFGLTFGASTVVLFLGIPILFSAFLGVRRYAARERRRTERLTGIQIQPPYRETRPEGLPGKILAHISDPATWRDTLHMALSAMFGVAWLVTVLTAWAVMLASVSLPIWFRWLPNHRVPISQSGGVAFYISTDPGIIALCTASAVTVWFLSPALLELETRIQVGFGTGLLGLSRTELERREASLRVSRGQAVSAAETERRRIERDLHDGAQQRLVALAMDLGMAKSKLKSGRESDNAAAAKLVAEAHEGVKLALSELRDLARGIHPAVLTDRGLDAALSALAARSPIPVETEGALTWRPSPEVESAAYFVASEALANMAKHSEAGRAWIELEHRAGHLRMTVGDDGIGGADEAAGTGLSGLADRVAPLDGILSVSSPIGGPTLIVMEIPCKPHPGY